MDNQQGPTVQHRELCSVLCGKLDEREDWGGMDACIFMAESFCYTLKLSQHCLLIGYTTIQNKKVLKMQMNILCTKMCDTVRVVKRYISLIVIC